jgi:NADH-quinone oxidoreductase subunit H
LGAIRSVAQMISYEVSVGFIIISVCLCSGSLNLSKIVFAQEMVFYLIPLFPLFLIFLVSILAETNRHPFDLAEAESELVSGFNVEYSGMPFALFFLAEYSNMLLMGAVTSILFVGGWLAPHSLLTFLFVPGTF